MNYSQWWAINKEIISEKILGYGLEKELEAHTLFQYCFHEGRAEGYDEAKKQQERYGVGTLVDAEWQKVEVKRAEPTGNEIKDQAMRISEDALDAAIKEVQETRRLRPKIDIEAGPHGVRHGVSVNDEYDSANVRVMLSHDYCHFEIHLEKSECTAKDIDDTRKEAARLAEKGVRQYIIAKRHIMSKVTNSEQRARLEKRVREINIRMSEGSEYTPEDMAAVKALKDIEFKISREYDYQDDWIEDEDEERDNIF